MKLWKVVLLLFLSTGLVVADKAVPQKWDFAWGMELELTGTSPFYRMSLPFEVYAGIVRLDLGDLRVLNGQGSVVPQHLQLPSSHQVAENLVVEAKVFPLYATRDSDIESILIRTPREWREDRVTIATRERMTASDEVLHGYILQLDEEDHRRPAKQLRLDWQVESRGFVHRLKLEYSNDLAHWRTHHSSVVIADLRYAGERLHKRDIPLGNIQAKYLRLTPVGESVPIDLLGVSVEFAGETREVIPNRLTIEQIEPGEQPGEYLFELPGPLPLATMDILPGEMNTLLRATLYSRADTEQRWTQRGSGLIYKLVAEGEPLQQTEFQLNQTQDRYWKLLVDASGGGFGAALPEVELGWTPHSLFFSARGEAPFTLVYGSGRVGPVSGNDLLTGFDGEHLQSLTSRTLHVGARYDLGGHAVLSKQAEPDWKRWLLWGVLVLGTAILGWMAWSTLRQLSD